jgi:hypothetical protein
MKRLILFPFLALTACGPMTVAEAERQCLERARLAKGPTGEVTIGVGSGGKTSAGIEVEIGSDFLLGRDPSAVFESCVMQKTGEMPSRPLIQQPGWR